MLCLRRFDDSPSSLGRLGWGLWCFGWGSSVLDGPLVELLPLGEGWDGASMLGWGLLLDGTHPRQLCRSCDFIAQG